MAAYYQYRLWQDQAHSLAPSTAKASHLWLVVLIYISGFVLSFHTLPSLPPP